MQKHLLSGGRGYKTLFAVFVMVSFLLTAMDTHAAVPPGGTCYVDPGIDLSLGMTNDSVLNLQKVLNNDPSTQIASSGVGSPGQETNYFGSLTESAVKRFQTNNAISPVSGLVGPLTRSKLVSIYGCPSGILITVAAPAAPVQAGSQYTITWTRPGAFTNGVNIRILKGGVIVPGQEFGRPTGNLAHDYNLDGIVDTKDVTFLSDVVLGNKTCPVGKICDLDGNGIGIEDVDTLKVNEVLPYSSLPDFGSFVWNIPTTLSPGSNYQILVLVEGRTSINGTSVNFGVVANPVSYDYNNDGDVDKLDEYILRDLIFQDSPCPAGKVCDTNGDGLVSVDDVITLVAYLASHKPAITVTTPASLPAGIPYTITWATTPQAINSGVNVSILKDGVLVPGQRFGRTPGNLSYDYNSDGVVDTNDKYILIDVALGTQSCPAGKICDINGGGVDISDSLALQNLVTQYSALPDSGSFTWNVPSGLTPGSGYQIKIFGENDATISGTSGSFTVTAPPVVSVSLSTDESLPIVYNTSATLRWSSANATSCTASGGAGAWAGVKTISGTQSIGPLISNTSFSIQCTGITGTDTKNITVTVAPPPPVSLSFTVVPSKVSEGGAATLLWDAQNTNSGNACTLSGGKFGTGVARAVSGNESTDALYTNTTYTMACAGPAGTVSRPVSVTIAPEVQNVQVVGAAPGTQFERGTQVTVSWTTKGPAGDNFKVTLLQNNVPVPGQLFSVTSTSNPRSYVWTVPPMPFPVGDYKMRVESAIDSTARGESALFSVVPPPSITLAQPIGSQVWQLGSLGHTIQWSKAGVVGPINVAIKLASPALFYNFDNSDNIVDAKDIEKLRELINNSATPSICKTAAGGKDCDVNVDGTIDIADITWMTNNVILLPGARIGAPLATDLASNSFSWNINQSWIIPARDYIISIYDKNNPFVEAHSAPITITPELIQMSIVSATLVPPLGTSAANTNKFTLADTIMGYTAQLQNKGVRPVPSLSISSYIEQGTARSEGYNAKIVCPPASPGTAPSGLCITSAPEQQISARINRTSPPEYDYNFDSVVDQQDVQFLIDVALGDKICPPGKVCLVDISDTDGVVTDNDIIKLVNTIDLFPTGVLKPGAAKAVFELRMADSVLSTIKLDVVIEPPPGIMVLTPNGGELWPLGVEETISWSEIGLVGDVKVELRQVDPRTAYDYNKDGVFSAEDIDELKVLLQTQTKATCRALTGLNCDANNDGVFGVDDTVWLTDNILSASAPQTITIPLTSSNQTQKTVKWTPKAPPVLPGSYKIAIYDLGDPSIKDESNDAFTISAGAPKITAPAQDGSEYSIYEKMNFEVKATHPIGLSDYRFSLYQNNTLIYDNVCDNDGILSFTLPINSSLVRKTDNRRVIDLLTEGQLRIDVSGKLPGGGYTNTATRVVKLKFDRTPPNISSPSDKQDINLGLGKISVRASHTLKLTSYKVSLYQNGILKYFNGDVPGGDTGMSYDLTKQTLTPQGEVLFRSLARGEVNLIVQGKLINNEYTTEASRLFIVTPLPPDYDLNDDDFVDSADLAILQATIIYDAALRRARDEGKPEPAKSALIEPCINLTRTKPKNCNYYQDFETNSSKKSIGMRIIDSRDAAIMISSPAYDPDRSHAANTTVSSSASSGGDQRTDSELSCSGSGVDSRSSSKCSDTVGPRSRGILGGICAQGRDDDL